MLGTLWGGHQEKRCRGARPSGFVRILSCSPMESQRGRQGDGAVGVCSCLVPQPHGDLRGAIVGGHIRGRKGVIGVRRCLVPQPHREPGGCHGGGMSGSQGAIGVRIYLVPQPCGELGEGPLGYVCFWSLSSTESQGDCLGEGCQRPRAIRVCMYLVPQPHGEKGEGPSGYLRIWSRSPVESRGFL